MQDKSPLLKTVYSDKGILLSFPAGIERSVQIINVQGKTIASFTLRNGIPALLKRNAAGRGILFAAWNENDGRKLVRLTNL